MLPMHPLLTGAGTGRPTWEQQDGSPVGSLPGCYVLHALLDTCRHPNELRAIKPMEKGKSCLASVAHEQGTIYEAHQSASLTSLLIAFP